MTVTSSPAAAKRGREPYNVRTNRKSSETLAAAHTLPINKDLVPILGKDASR